jgi:hypothetical protein
MPTAAELANFSGPWLNQFSFTFTQSGVYLATASATDLQGNALTASAVIQVFDPTALDVSLRAKWTELRAALARNDIDAAMVFFANGAKIKYRGVFQDLTPDLAVIASQFRDLAPVSFTGGIMEYAITRDRGGETFAY